jgi:protein-S-isoprenylcysteine O-methyltransferase Ste14
MWRHVRAIGLLPGISAGAIPAAILVFGGSDVGWGLDGGLAVLPVVAGAALICLGLLLMYRTIALFAREGDGTLAPWDPPRRLVVRGPYRYVRNPMITGVITILTGEAALFGSPWILAWAAAFLAGNNVWFPRVEEPALVKRFGRDYEEYRRNVPRWVPRRTPWTPKSSSERM